MIPVSGAQNGGQIRRFETETGKMKAAQLSWMSRLRDVRCTEPALGVPSGPCVRGTD